MQGAKRSYLLTERLVGGNWPRFQGIVTHDLRYIENRRGDSTEPRSRELYDLRYDPTSWRTWFADPRRSCRKSWTSYTS